MKRTITMLITLALVSAVFAQGPPPPPSTNGVCDIEELLLTGRRLVGKRSAPMIWPPAAQEPCFNLMCEADRESAKGEAAVGFALRVHAFEDALWACETDD